MALSCFAQPSKEYIRLGGRVIAIESTAPPPTPDFSVAVNAASVNVAAGSVFSNQITITPSNGFTGTLSFSFTATNGLTVASPQFTPVTVNISGTAPVSTTFSGTIPANATAQAYQIVIKATRASPLLERFAAPFSLTVTPPPVTPQSVVFAPGQYLTGSAPASLDALTNWRLEARLHISSTLAVGTSLISGLGSTRLLVYRYSAGSPYYSLIFQDGGGPPNLELSINNPDVFIRVQRNGNTKSLKAWNVDAAGTLSSITNGEVSGTWYSSATLSPGFSLGAATTQESSATGAIWPFNGQLAFYRFFSANADNATTPDQCDSASALIRYEFENNLTHSGTASVALTPTGNPAYQSTPATSCAAGGPPPSFTLTSGAQSPSPIAPGSPAAYPISINRQNFPGTVTFTGCTGPTGVSCPSVATTAASVNVTVNTLSTTPAGTHNVVLSASASGLPTITTNLSLIITASGQPPPTFALTVSPNQVTFSPTGTQNLTATLFPGNNFTGNVSFTCAPPSGQTVPSAITCTAPNPASDVQPQRPFTITAAAGAAQGTYVFRLTGVGPQAQTNFADIQVTITAGVVRGVISPSYREISTSPGAYYQFLSIVENSGNSQVNWALSPVSGGLQLTYPPSGNGTATAGPANYVFYRPPSSLGGYTQQFVILSGTPAVGGQAGNATLLLRTDPYAPPIVCRASTINVTGCLSPTETNLPASLSANASWSWMRIESHYTGNYGGIASDGRLHQTMRVAYALDPNNPFDSGLNACLIRIDRSLGYGAPDGQTMSLEGGPTPTNASIGPGAPANSTITNGVCTVSRPLTNMAVNFAADSTKAWLDIYIRFNAPSAPRSVFYKIDTYNNTSSGTVLVKDTPLPVVP